MISSRLVLSRESNLGHDKAEADFQKTGESKERLKRGSLRVTLFSGGGGGFCPFLGSARAKGNHCLLLTFRFD